MRKNNGTPGIAGASLCRVPLAVVALVLAFLLGGAAMAPDALPAAALKSAALKTAGGPPSVSAAYDADEEDHNKSNDKRQGKRGQLRRAASSTFGASQSIGRLVPADRSDTDPATAPPSARRSAAAASRPLQLPVLHCVFRC